MKKYNRVLASIVVGSLLLTGCGKEVAEVEEQNATPVETMVIENSSIKKELVYAGKVVENESVAVTSKLSGQVEEVYFNVGDYVNKGDVLFTLDKSDIQDQITQLEAQLNVSSASVDSAQLGLSQATEGGQIQSSKLQLETAVKNAKTALEGANVGVDNAKITLENTRVSLDDVETKYQNTKTLYESGVVTKNDFDSMELAYNQTKNGFEQAQLGLVSANATLQQAQNGHDQAVESLNLFNNKTTGDSKDMAENSVKTAVAGKGAVETQLKIARDTLKDTSVKSPISGVISQRNVEPTNMVSAALQPFVIVDTVKVTVDVKVSEKIINQINVGDNVDVDISTISDSKMVGQIKTINPVADATGTFPVSVEIDNTDGMLKVGMFANVHISEKESNNTTVVPRNTIIENKTEKFVFVVDGDTARKVIVETGIDNGEEIEIISGVTASDVIVTTGQTYLSDGSLVNVVTSEEE